MLPILRQMNETPTTKITNIETPTASMKVFASDTQRRKRTTDVTVDANVQQQFLHAATQNTPVGVAVDMLAVVRIPLPCSQSNRKAPGICGTHTSAFGNTGCSRKLADQI